VHFTLCCFLTHMLNKTLSATVLTLWVAPPKNNMTVIFFIVDQSRSSGCVYQMWGTCTMLNIVYLSPLSNSISHFVAATYNEKEQRIHSHFLGGCRWTNWWCSLKWWLEIICECRIRSVHVIIVHHACSLLTS